MNTHCVSGLHVLVNCTREEGRGCGELWFVPFVSVHRIIGFVYRVVINTLRTLNTRAINQNLPYKSKTVLQFHYARTIVYIEFVYDFWESININQNDDFGASKRVEISFIWGALVFFWFFSFIVCNWYSLILNWKPAFGVRRICSENQFDMCNEIHVIFVFE